MQTYSHLLITAALRKPLEHAIRQKDLPPLRLAALLWGSVLPDIPLILISIVCAIIDLRSGLALGSEAFRQESLLRKLFEEWFFSNPWVISAQNIFHSPLLLLAYILLSYMLWRRGVRAMGYLFWLFCASLFHSGIDILVHHDDGPLLFFPLNWSLRFASPVSYWDPQHHGIPFAIFEHSLDLAILLGLVFVFFRNRAKRS